jgi:hypothetical protein
MKIDLRNYVLDGFELNGAEARFRLDAPGIGRSIEFRIKDTKKISLEGNLHELGCANIVDYQISTSDLSISIRIYGDIEIELLGGEWEIIGGRMEEVILSSL